MEIDANEEKVTIDFSNPPMSYSYDENGIFTQHETCSPDPLESEIKGEAVWLLPANATLIEPPAAVEKHVRVFKNGAWVQVEDNRGTKYWLPGDTWQTEPREMKDLGALPDGASLTRPEQTAEEKAAEEKRRKEAEAEAARVPDLEAAVAELGVTSTSDKEESDAAVLDLAAYAAELEQRIAKLEEKNG